MSPADNMKAAEDFILVVLHAHILAAAAEICESGVESVFELSAMIIDSYVKLSTSESTTALESRDGVFLYACNFSFPWDNWKTFS